LEIDERGERSERGTREYAAWRERREEIIAAGSVPAMRVVSATELSVGATDIRVASTTEPHVAGMSEATVVPASELSVDGSDTSIAIVGMTALSLPEVSQIQIERISRAATRPRGKRFGTLVHSILAQVALDASIDSVATKAHFYGRIFNASDDEIGAATVAVVAALASPLMRRAAAATIVRREVPLLLEIETAATRGHDTKHETRSAISSDTEVARVVAHDDDSYVSASTIVEGIADFAFVEHRDGIARWMVVDFKTDFDLDRRLAEYRIQVALYMRAIGRATTMPVTGYLLLI
jgi:ATP-dependent helicase/nuclease subunit A